jgi:surfactin synthase thioesterase subunit
MEDNELIFAQNFNRDGSRTPPLFAYSAYPAPEDLVYPPFSQQPYQPLVTTSEYTDFLQPVPVTLPSMMHFHEAIKREDENTLSPYNIYSQGALPSIDFINQRPYEDVSHPHVSRTHQSASTIRTIPNVYM